MNSAPTLGQKVAGVLLAFVTIACWAIAIATAAVLIWQIGTVYRLLPL